MDDAKLVIELQDRSGGGGQASALPGVPGASSVPGSTLASDFQNKVTQTGAGATLGQGAAPAGPTPTIPTVSASQPAATSTASVPSPTPTSSVAGSGDPLLAATRQLFEADPKITLEELQQALGIEKTRAENLFRGVRDRPTPTDSGSTAPTSTDIPKPPDSGSTAPTSTDIPKPPPLTREQILAEAAHRPPPIIEQATENVQDEVVQSARQTHHQVGSIINGLSSIASQAGLPGAGIAGKAMHTVAPELMSAAAASPTMTAIAGPAAAIIGSLAVATGITRSLIGTAINEGDRAAAIVGNLSPEAAQARAEAEVRQVMANLRSAQRLGDEAADFIENRSRLSTSLQGLRDVAAEPLLKDLNNILGTLAGAVDRFNEKVQNDPATQKFIQDRVTAGLDTLLGGGNPILGKLLGPRFRKLFEDLNKALKREENLGNPFGWFKEQKHLEPTNLFGYDSGREPLDAVVESLPGLTF